MIEINDWLKELAHPTNPSIEYVEVDRTKIDILIRDDEEDSLIQPSPPEDPRLDPDVDDPTDSSPRV
ncbi:hypothetical protein [Pseudomonas vranovensis]|uniref:hypothetical protein n=1 Tax=Pseudomonas vranovensis TaxID=321661 RepID=UPI000FBE6A37|nr:hypothetical protein [Pseudomonas vranovensis]